MKRPRVVVTGMGAFSPLGLSAQESWEGLVAGRSGIGPMTLCDPSDFPCQIAGEVKGFDPRKHIPGRESQKDGAIFSAGSVCGTSVGGRMPALEIDPETSHRYGVLLGNGNGGFPTTEEGCRVMIQRGGMRVSPFFFPNDAAQHGGIEHQPNAGI